MMHRKRQVITKTISVLESCKQLLKITANLEVLVRRNAPTLLKNMKERFAIDLEPQKVDIAQSAEMNSGMPTYMSEGLLLMALSTWMEIPTTGLSEVDINASNS